MRSKAFFAVMTVLFGAASIQAKWFGERDTRNDPESFLNDEEQRAFSGVGRVACPADQVQFKEGTRDLLWNFTADRPIFEKVNLVSTAFHVGSFSLLATNSHAFSEDYWDDISQSVRERLVDPKTCMVIFYEYSTGKELEVLPIKEALIRWSEPSSFGDTSDDIALIKLYNESKTPSDALIYDRDFSDDERLLDERPVTVTVVGFHGDLLQSYVKRKTSGFIYLSKLGFRHELNAERAGLPFKRAERTVVGDYAANHGASGSPIVGPEGLVIGIHQGSSNVKDVQGISLRTFNRQDNYNMAVLFDDQFHLDVQRMK